MCLVSPKFLTPIVMSYPPRATLRSFFHFFLSLLVVLMVGCAGDSDGDPEPEPTPGPDGVSNAEIDLAEKNQKFFMKTATLNISATDAEGVAKIEAFIDGAKIGERSFTETQATFSLSWNTTTALEGQRTLKIVVKDQPGNTTQKEFKLRVRNILMTITGSPVQISTSPKSEGWVYLSDETTGATLAVKQFTKADGVVKLECPEGFTGDTFNMTFLGVLTNTIGPANKRTEFTTYTGVSVGSRNYLPATTLPSIGEATVSVLGVPQELNFYITGPTVASVVGSVDATTRTYKIGVQKNANDIFFSSRGQMGSLKYKMLENIQPGDAITIQYDAFTDFETNNVTLPSAISHSADLYAYRIGLSGSFFVSRDDYYIDDATSMSVKYPTESYFDYYTLFTIFNDGNGVSYRNFISQETAPTEVLRLNTTIDELSFDGTNISASLNGEGNVAFASFSTNVNSGSPSHWVTHAYYLPVGQINIVVPQIPATIKATYLPEGFPTTQYANVEINDASYLDSYADFANAAYSVPRIYTLVTKSLSHDISESGRRRTDKKELMPLFVDPALRMPSHK
jgi:hypothetical protein